MDGYPTTYNAYKTRLHRWIRGDYQIILWLMKKRLNILSKYNYYLPVYIYRIVPFVLINYQ